MEEPQGPKPLGLERQRVQENGSCSGTRVVWRVGGARLFRSVPALAWVVRRGGAWLGCWRKVSHLPSDIANIVLSHLPNGERLPNECLTTHTTSSITLAMAHGLCACSTTDRSQTQFYSCRSRSILMDGSLFLVQKPLMLQKWLFLSEIVRLHSCYNYRIRQRC